MGAAAETTSLAQRIRAAEERLAEAYRRLGIRRTLPPMPEGEVPPQTLLAHLEWIEKELRTLERAARRAQTRRQPRSWRERLRRLAPSRVSARLALLGLATPESEPDPYGADADVFARLQGLLAFLFEEYWRVEVLGIHHVPASGPAILVANHGGLLPFDGLMLQYAVSELHPAGRQTRLLIEDWFMRLPILNLVLTRLGAMRGSPLNARRLLEEGELVALFPEGAKGVLKSYRDRYRVQRFGRGGTIRLALATRAPIVPVAIVGPEEAYPLLAKATLPTPGREEAFLPVTPLFPWLGPLGVLPLPSKWLIAFGEPIHLEDFPPETADDEITINTLNEELRGRVQEMVSHLLQRRRSPWLG